MYVCIYTHSYRISYHIANNLVNPENIYVKICIFLRNMRLVNISAILFDIQLYWSRTARRYSGIFYRQSNPVSLG